ncbi:MAG: hypothetical protein RRY54_01070 [Angelakisella sp.]
MKHFPTYLTVFVLLCVLTCSTAVVFATAPTAAPPLTILGPLTNSNPTSVPLPFVKVGDSLTSLTLPDKIFCTLAPSSGIYECPVIWELNSPDTSTPGYKALIGILSPEAGYQLADGVSNRISYGVMVTAPGMEAQAITDISPEYSDHYVIAVGDSPDTLSLRDMGAICTTEHFGEYFICPVRWALETVNTSVPASYTVAGEPVLPDGFCLPVGLSALPDLSQTVGVVAPDCIDLSAAWIDPKNSNFLHCQWIYQAAEESPLVLQYSTVKDEWHDDFNSQSDPSGNNYGIIWHNNLGLHINLDYLTLHTDYWFRVLYEGNRYSNTLHVYLKDKNFIYEVGGSGGDRDGGDQEGNRLPPLLQPAPDTSDDDDSSVSPVLETVTESSTILSGARLNQLTVEGGTMLFEKHGVAIELPSSLTNSLNLSAEQLLELTLLRPAEDTFSLAILADGKALTALPRTTVRLPWAAEATQKLECVNLDGAHSSEGIYEPASGTVRCTISETGAYRIRAVPPVAEPPAPVTAPEPPTPVTAPEPPTPATAPEPPASSSLGGWSLPVTVAAPPASSSFGNWSLPAVALLIGAGWLLYRRHPRG